MESIESDILTLEDLKIGEKNNPDMTQAQRAPKTLSIY